MDGDFGCLLRGPNDIVFDAHGGFWFTDHGKNRERERDVTGVFYAKADGSHLEEVIFPSENPNGVGLSPDGKALYAAETYTCRLMKFNVIAPGKVDGTAGPGGPGIPLYRPAGYKFFDSLGIEACGNICVATIGESGISVISPQGELVEFVPTPDIFTTNICWGGEDLRTAYITLSGTGQLISMPWARPGLKLNY
jgi:gluconolactonase